MTLSLVESLDEALMGDEPDLEAEPSDPGNAEQADRFLYAIARLMAKGDEINRLADERRMTIDLWESVEIAKILKRISWYEHSLELYHRNCLAVDRGAKTIVLPSGKLVSRAQQPEYRFDSEVFVDWAIHNDRRNLVRIPETAPQPAPQPDVNAVKAEIDVRDGIAFDIQSGERVPGLIVVTRDRKFTVDVSHE